MRIVSSTPTVALACLLLGGCISSTTGSSAPEANNSEAAELNYQLGARYYNAGNYSLAKDRLILATKLDPRLAKAYSTLALTYEALDNARLARDAYESAVRVAPRNFEVRNAHAVFLCRQSDYVEAQKNFERAMNHVENDNAEVTMTNAGICMAQKPDVAQAEQYYRKALDRNPNYGEALLQICLLKFREKDYLSSRAFLQRFMSGNPASAGVLYLASRIEDLLGNDRGRTDYEDELIRQFPTSKEARKVLGTN